MYTLLSEPDDFKWCALTLVADKALTSSNAIAVAKMDKLPDDFTALPRSK
jgi:hypothetical protein